MWSFYILLKELEYEDKKKLFDEQKKMLDTFLKTGAIDKMQYKKSINGLIEKMNMKDIIIGI